MRAPTSLRQFRSSAVKVFKKANPGLQNLQIEWVESLRIVKWADGSSGFRGSFVATADGYRPTTLYATWCGGLRVRPGVR